MRPSLLFRITNLSPPSPCTRILSLSGVDISRFGDPFHGLRINQFLNLWAFEITTDGNTEGRLKKKLFFGKWGYFKTRNEVVLSGGDSMRKGKGLKRLSPDLFRDDLLFRHPFEHSRRFVDLIQTIDEKDDYILYHRSDWPSLTLLPKRGVACIGCQAVTWGKRDPF